MPLPPKNLNDKHRWIAWLKLAGRTREEIADELGYAPTYISAVTESPMFKALMDQLRADMRQRTIGSVVDQIVNEGPNSVKVLVEVRDNIDEPGATRAMAARDLLDRNPETAKVSREDRRTETRIVFDGRAMSQLAAVLAEDAGMTIDAPLAIPVETAAPGSIPTLDALLAEMRQQEEAER